MFGNVWEWCSDGYDDYDVNTVKDPTGSFSCWYWAYRVYRDGCWDNYANGCRITYRSNCDSSGRSNGIGFRIVRSSVLQR